MNFLFYLLIPVLVGYLIGSIPFGYIAGKLKGIDLTKEGSGSTGTTNVLRLVGKKEAIFVLIGDFAKGLVAPIIAVCLVKVLISYKALVDITLNPSLPLPMVLASFASLVGHVKSCWIGFKGGKAVATGVGTIFALDWRVGLITAIIWGLTVYISKISSLGALVAVPSTVITMFFVRSFNTNLPDKESILIYCSYCLIGTAYIIFKHKNNIQRLLNGTEPKIGQKSS
ncbi:MAG: glycerol-3-phosphate 1-O-acyltransferase PlsY [Candidatus Caenarcaniphilales bacterium]|nr:glycerol-3-phosphate 1-O-acyltransferase PlsY [Candidatus Caenarcaniphilales bacterium]